MLQNDSENALNILSVNFSIDGVFFEVEVSHCYHFFLEV